jgi:hypothetical protein
MKDQLLFVELELPEKQKFFDKIKSTVLLNSCDLRIIDEGILIPLYSFIDELSGSLSKPNIMIVLI